MPVLIVRLPFSRSGSGANNSASSGVDYAYVQTRDGLVQDSYGTALANALPRLGLGADVVALVPFQALSWHRVELPKAVLGGNQARLRSVLDGLLEERLLDEPSALHVAVSPYAKPEQAVWVAACDKAWLRAVLQPLEAAGRQVSRIVPEFAPREDAESAPQTFHALGDAEQGWWVRISDKGVLALPLGAEAVQITTKTAAVDGAAPGFTAEPAVVASAQALLGWPAQMQQAAQRWVQSARTPWDLAQFDLANSGRQRSAKKLTDAWRELLHAPQWRALRWGVVALALMQVVGLNAWAWKEKAELAQLRSGIRSVLTDTFPQVKLVVDAPIQMAREVAQLRQSTGAASNQDLEVLLSLTGQAVPAAQAASTAGVKGLDYVDGELRLKGVPDDLTAALSPRLEPRGISVQSVGDAVVLKAVHP